jgi:ACS family hexuronate transporter-like MFS transporter
MLKSPVPLRWLVFSVFVLSSTLNYLDRMVLAALAPLLKTEFDLSNADFGLVLAAFSITYAISAPLAGLLIDRIGLNRGISLAVGIWSLAGMATGLVKGAGGLLWCRAALGVGEAGGVPATGKTIVSYLRPDERALGNAYSQMGLGIGAMMAPPLAVALAVRFGWRSVFVLTGVAGLLWIPLWNWVARKAPYEAPPEKSVSLRSSQILRDRLLWGFVAANILSMTTYTLWTNWTTIFLVQAHRLTLVEAAWLAWIPPVFFNLGGLLGGWLSLRWMRSGLGAIPSRMRACLASALALLATAAVPWAPGAGLAVATICLSAFWSSAMSVNLYTLPLDVYGARHAAFTVSMLTSAYGVMQTAFSPLIGRLIDDYGFGPVCVLFSVLPLAGYSVLRASQPEKKV